MNVVLWSGVAMIICWAVLWLGIKLAVGAIHALLLLGLVLVAWAVISRARTRVHRF
ncbi:MAG TPA: hypothetical protein VF193_12920 [Steroidobacter sp.]